MRFLFDVSQCMCAALIDWTDLTQTGSLYEYINNKSQIEGSSMALLKLKLKELSTHSAVC